MSRSRSKQITALHQQTPPDWRAGITCVSLVVMMAVLGSCTPTVTPESPDRTETRQVIETATPLSPGSATATNTPSLVLGYDWPIIGPENANAIDLIGIFEPLRLIEVLGSPQWDHLAVISTDRVLILPIDEFAPWGQIELFRVGDLTAAVSDGQTLVMAFREGGARLYDSTDTNLLHEFEIDLRLLEISGDGALLAGCGLDNAVYIWDIESGELLLELPLEGMARSLTFSPDARTLAVELEGGMFEGLEIWSVESGERLGRLEWEDQTGPIYFVRIAPDWSSSMWVSRASVVLMELESGDPIAFLPHEDFVDEAVFSPDGEMVATTSAAQVDGEMAGVVDLWEVASGSKLATLVNGEAAVLVTFSPDGRLLASVTYNGVIRVWDVESAELLAEKGGRNVQVFRMFFAMEGRLLVTASWDGMVHFWGVENDLAE